MNYILFVDSIECLNLRDMTAWTTLIYDTSLVQRCKTSAVVISATRFLVFGGHDLKEHESPYIFDLKTSQVQRVPCHVGITRVCEFTREAVWIGQ